jgi:hypothetical protein
MGQTRWRHMRFGVAKTLGRPAITLDTAHYQDYITRDDWAELLGRETEEKGKGE